MGWVIAVISLATLGAMVLLPNYLAIRYAMFGGSEVAAAGGAAAAAAVGARPARKAAGWKWVQRGYMWKALSPFLFAFSVILGIAVGGVAGIVLVSVMFLNLVLGFMGWDAYIPGKR